MFDWFSFLTYAVITAVTPGPNNIMSMANGTRKGFIASLPFNFGILFGFSLVMLICTFFCEILAWLIPSLIRPLQIVGALYLVWLSWQIYKSSSDLGKSRQSDSFWSGAILQFVNVKIYIYCILSMQTYILPIYHGQPRTLIGFAFLLAFIGFAFTLLWSAFGAVFAILFSRYSKFVNTVLAVALLYCTYTIFA